MDHEIKLKIASHTVTRPDSPGFDESPVGVAAAVAVDALNEATAARQAVLNDPLLSNEGKRRKIVPIEDALWTTYGRQAEAVTAFGQAADAREAHLYRLLPVAPDPAMTPYDIALDAETRGWWRGLDADGRSKALKAIRADDKAHAGAIRALLRTPVPLDLADHETRILREMFEDSRRLANPEEAARVDMDREHLAIAERLIAQIRGIGFAALPDWNAGRLLTFLLDKGMDSAAVAIFGAADVAKAQQQRKARARVQKLAA
ncbi:MAG: hypothetical protein KDG52_21715 [Rhodocyclaceae bacterium]|nr:hypothetical protein [Rhodocyclaceae bacterium]